MEQEYDWFWLCSIPGFYEKDRRKLLQRFSEPAAVREAAAAGKDVAFLGEAKARAIKKHGKNFCAEEEYHKLREQGINFISCRHDDYPGNLLQICDYPSGLFFKGRLPKENENCMAVIGARMCSGYGKDMAQKLAKALAQNGVAVVSGMAFGIDAAAQEACIEAGGTSYAVLGCGVDVCYPRENRRLYERLQKCGGILSEYAPGTPPLSYHFPMRNRIISGLVQIVVVAEARKKSGTLITADLALEQGRDVYAFPGRTCDPLSAGCNRLIRQGAGIITDIEDFLKENGYLIKKDIERKNYHLGLATSENLVYSCLDSETKSLQEIADETNLPVCGLMSALGALQIKGLISETAKNYYIRIR